ncbi:MAG: PAS-domain containing protein, partial [Azospirillaceae bacterium]
PPGRRPARAALAAGAAVLAAGAAAFGSAGAQDPAGPGTGSPGLPAWLVAAAILVVVMAGLSATIHRAYRRERRAAAEGADSVARYEAFLDAAPLAWFGWSTAGARSVSPGLSRLFGVAEIASIEDMEAALEPGDAAALDSAVTRLKERGEAFVRVARTPAGRVLEIAGRRGTAPPGAAAGETFDVLWVADVTAREAERARRAHQAGEAARLADERAALLDALPVPVWLRRADLGLDWVNRAYCEAVDADRDTVLRDGMEIARSIVREEGRALAREARRTGEAAQGGGHVVIGGQRRRLSVSEMPVFARTGSGSGGGAGPAVIGWALDETELEEAVAERDRHIAAHAEVLEQLQTAIAIFGPDKRLAFFNQAYVQLWHFDETWLETGPGYDEMLEDLRARRRLPEYADFPAFKKAQLDLFTRLIEAEQDLFHLPDGTTLRSIVTPHPFGGLLFMLEDVTSALALERSYNTLMAVQRESLDNLAEGVAVFGGDGRLKLSNPAFARLWGLGDDTLAGHPHVAELVEQMRGFYRDDVEWEAARAVLLDGGLEREARHRRLTRPDGSVIDYATVPLPDGGVLNSFLDVTDSAQVEQALRRSNEALETADRLKSEFIANVSYQLRTPLNAIMGFAEILEHQYFGALNERQLDYSRSIIEASERLLALINDILDLATIEAGYMALERRPVPVAELLSSVHELTREWAGKQSLKVRVDVAEDVGTIEADDRRLKQALFNLVSNAVKFTPPGGRITLSARREGDRVRLSVTDTGIGIPEAEQDRVLGRFERAHPELRQSGVGLGLALVKSFVELHGGTLELDSRPGAGTTVSCLLPVAAPGAAGALPTEHAVDPRREAGDPDVGDGREGRAPPDAGGAARS